jgi:hypothetical protein
MHEVNPNEVLMILGSTGGDFYLRGFFVPTGRLLDTKGL